MDGERSIDDIVNQMGRGLEGRADRVRVEAEEAARESEAA